MLSSKFEHLLKVPAKPLWVKDGYHVNYTVSSNFLLDKGRVAENLQKECLCCFIRNKIIFKFHFITYRDLYVTVFSKRLPAIIYIDEVQHDVSTPVNDKER